ncbi:MAG: hypothetical protein IPM45_05410 [Acidimicrobiales bacterium]|nr:hypothetical protein [Acidimicrobiales bacterium]
MTARVVRWVVVTVCAVGVVGMIVASIADVTGAVATFGLVTAAAVISLMVVTAVAGPAAFERPPADRAAHAEDDGELVAARVEDRIQALVAAGADERAVRELVGDAVRLGRTRR